MFKAVCSVAMQYLMSMMMCARGSSPGAVGA
jgi:hypothetical protein